ncbi:MULTISPECIES: bifunctional biotin--[acetyl-CoA-carboxylase] ligase/biotin operon repressor BirA [unclassified Stenotrophomonas]|jgi:BirA family biotin operon repressor/biotin-[acetyl-CoA-carboxylase] ligase|uniref:bifunctional biotin--[acetyl-CoA-carboxylase] ligase/biotin operon repressor BirA n=1 Tax=unclassified Stenotrophomonas TaxID=196198 RepID=UPI0021C6B256|nr:MULTISPECIES: bifunctional biotin--[acetyl-CoA-carboxylase] ligase/biotin operon repressor BirA [unclassified Stenotrophomonas]
MEAAVDDRQLLAKLGAGRLSGDALARELGQTRAAIWKRIQGLRSAGIAIEGRAGDGYQLQQPLDLLDADTLRAALPAAVLPLLASLDIAWSVGSTNTELLRCSAPARGTAVLLAERQTGGRGRRGREWTSPLAAHVYLSVLRGFAGGLSRLGGLSLVAGVAVAEALRAQGIAGVTLKWPNDLVVEGRKLGGLLVEGGGEFAGPARAVIGLGVNVRMPADHGAQITQPWTDLATLAGAQGVARNALVAAILASLLPALEAFDADGLAPFLPRYAALDGLAGRAVRVEEGGQWIEGHALGLADDGALRVRTAQGERVFHAGEVSVRMQ